MSVTLCALLALQGATGDRVWLDTTSTEVPSAEWAEVQGLLAVGLRRRDLELTTRSDGRAVVVVQVRRVNQDYFVLAASGPAAAGRGVSMSRRVASGSIDPGTLAVVLAQTAEELVQAVLNAEAAPAPPTPPVEPEPTRVETPTPPPSPPPEVTVPWEFAAEPAAAYTVTQGGASTMEGGAVVRVQHGVVGGFVAASGGALLPKTINEGVVRGTSVTMEGGLSLQVLHLGRWRLSVDAGARGQWLRAEGLNPSGGLAAASATGWAVLAFAGLRPEMAVTDWLGVGLEASAGWTFRALAFTADSTRLFALSGVVGRFSLSAGVHW